MSPSQVVGERRRSRFLTDPDWSFAPCVAPTQATTWQTDPIFGSEMLPTPTDDEWVTLRVSDDTYQRMQEPLARVGALVALGPDWDSYGGRPLQPGAAQHAVRLLAAILTNDVPVPSIVPTSEGGLQLEWHREDADLEMEVTPERSVRVFLRMSNGQTWEGSLANSQGRLSAFLTHVVEDRLVNRF